MGREKDLVVKPMPDMSSEVLHLHTKQCQEGTLAYTKSTRLVKSATLQRKENSIQSLNE